MEDISKQAVELIIPHQTHGTNSLIIDSSFLNLTSVEKSSRLEGIDALITREPGCCICISTADCVPVLLYDTKHEIIAAVHAGWRGTVNFIIGHALERMSAYYGTCGQDVVACIGPSISFESFEVGEDVYEAFRQNEFDMSRLAKQQVSTGKWHIDLWEANRLQMLDFGIPASQIEIAGVCTYIHHDDFFSARRLGLSSGRILSGILKRS